MRRLTKDAATTRQRARRAFRKLVLEQLESRLTPAVTLTLTPDSHVSLTSDDTSTHLTLSIDSSGFLRHDLTLSGMLESDLDFDSNTAGVQAIESSKIASLTIIGG